MLPRFVKSHCVKYHHVSPPLTAYTIMRLLDLIGYCLDPCKSMRELAPHCPSLMDITVGYLGISWDTLWGILWPHEPSDEVANMQQRIEQHPAGPKWSNCNTDSFQARPLKLGKTQLKHIQTCSNSTYDSQRGTQIDSNSSDYDCVLDPSGPRWS